MVKKLFSNGRALFMALTLGVGLGAQVPQAASAQAPGRPADHAIAAEQAALIDVSGYWASIITADWRWRMMTAPIGDFSSVPLNPAGIQVAKAWNPKADEVARAQCKAYGAGGLMRLPEELHVVWSNPNTLEIQTDNGIQKRLLHFDGHGNGEPASLQGYSMASWFKQVQVVGFNPPFGGPKPHGGGTLKVVTTRMLPGYLRRNGVPYSGDTKMTEYFDRLDDEDTSYLILTSVIDDPTYLRDVFITTEEYRSMPDGSRWNPQPCTIVPPTARAR